MLTYTVAQIPSNNFEIEVGKSIGPEYPEERV